MPERAEIEAAIKDAMPEMESRFMWAASTGNHPDATAEGAVRTILEPLLDRVRDARDDEEAGWLSFHCASGEHGLCDRTARCACECHGAKSPQGQDHEAPEFDDEAITDILVAIDDVLEGYGRERMDIIDGPTVDALRDAVKRELVAFVARSSPSRDGTVAVEDVRAQTIVGITMALRNAKITPEGGLDVTDTWDLAADFIEREFGSARAGESNEGGNQ
jgi:hypothetical protein